ncbi:hypothetical protein DYB38_013367, partial [Aphanomyces astaci]
KRLFKLLPPLVLAIISVRPKDGFTSFKGATTFGSIVSMVKVLLSTQMLPAMDENLQLDTQLYDASDNYNMD